MINTTLRLCNDKCDSATIRLCDDRVYVTLQLCITKNYHQSNKDLLIPPDKKVNPPSHHKAGIFFGDVLLELSVGHRLRA